MSAHQGRAAASAPAEAVRPPAGRPWRYLLSGAALDAEAQRLREREDRVPSPPARIAASAIARVVATTMRARFAITLSGELPPTGCVLVSHHSSYWDGVVAVALDPRVVPITSGNWRSIPIVGWVLHVYGVLWTGDQTVASAVSLVGRGNACWIAPRAYDRSGGASRAHLGAARICVAAGAPAVPLALSGFGGKPRTRRLRPSAAIAIGEGVWPDADESAERFSARLEATLPTSAF
ncbi:MAG TPA: lysophospholipid acyltransferase family protein [Solirubrobacteraceae bacterium]